jgi:organic hydroperoxide reductase OsmC/OhrA
VNVLNTYITNIRLAGPKKGIVYLKDVVECEVSLPAEFGGMWEKVNPEEIFISAINACVMMSFLFFAEKEHLPITSYDATATTSIETVDGKKAVSTVILDVSITSRSERARIEEILLKAKEHSLVLNAVRVPVEINYTINGEYNVVVGDKV